MSYADLWNAVEMVRSTIASDARNAREAKLPELATRLERYVERLETALMREVEKIK